MEQKSSFDSRTIVVIFLCLGVWFAWQQYLERKYPETLPAKTATGAPAEERALPQPLANTKNIPSAALPAQSTKGPEKTWDYEDQNWKLTVSSYGGRIADVQLKNYTDSEGKPIALTSNKLPGYLLTEVEGAGTLPKLDDTDFTLVPLSKESVQLTANVGGLEVKKILTIVPEKYIVKTQIVVSGKTSGLQKVNVNISQPALAADADGGGGFLSRRSTRDLQEYFFNHGTKTKRLVITKPIETTNFDQTHFASLGSRYFTTLLFNRGNVLPDGQAITNPGLTQLKLSYPVLDANSPINLSFDLYAGPKLLDQLKQVDEQAAQVVDFGFFALIAVPLLQLMKLLFGLFHNYGLAIIGLTILVRIITFPFTYVSYKSMRAMQKIQPEIARLKEIYKDNTAGLNQEMMKLMKENKVNPAGGCVPLLLQLPVFWALYQVLQNSIELYHSPFLGWIHDLSLKDPFYVLPVLMGISMLLQQKLTPNTMDPAQAKVMMIMPVFFAFLMANLPSGLTLYIFVSTLFGILQQVFMMQDRKTMPQGALVRRS